MKQPNDMIELEIDDTFINKMLKYANGGVLETGEDPSLRFNTVFDQTDSRVDVVSREDNPDMFKEADEELCITVYFDKPKTYDK